MSDKCAKWILGLLAILTILLIVGCVAQYAALALGSVAGILVITGIVIRDVFWEPRLPEWNGPRHPMDTPDGQSPWIADQ